MLSQYVLIMIWIGFWGLLGQSLFAYMYEVVDGEERLVATFRAAFLVFLPIIIMSAFKSGSMGGDVFSYIVKLREAPTAISDISNYISGITKDKGFYVFTAVLKHFIGNNVVLYFGAIALIQGGCLIKTFRRYSWDYIFTVFLFIASTDYVVWMFNGLRQFMAVAIIFAGLPLITQRKYMSAIALIIIASTFHQSALIMIPIIFICQGKAFNWKTLALIAAAVAAVVFIGSFTSFLDDSLAYTQYGNVVTDYTTSQDDGTNPIRVLVYSIPTLLSVYGAKRIKDEEDRIIHLFVNMSIVSSAIYFISMFTSGIFLGRLPIYTSLFGYMLLPWELDNLFSIGNQKLVKTVCVLGYLGFYYFQMHITWGFF